MNKNVFDNIPKVGNLYRAELLLAKIFGKKFISMDVASEQNDCTVVTHMRKFNRKIYIIEQHIT